MQHSVSRALAALVVCGSVVLGAPGVVGAKTSHAGWPVIDGVFFRNAGDRDVTREGSSRSDELLGGHGDDTLSGRGRSDVLWGDHKPSGQTGAQWDHLDGGDGRDFIYASHGRNTIRAGAGDDYVKAHYGRGFIDCGPGRDTLYVSRRAQPKYTIRHCEVVSHRTLGY